MSLTAGEEPLKVGDILINNETKQEVKIKDTCVGVPDSGVFEYYLEDGSYVKPNDIGEGKKFSRGLSETGSLSWKQICDNSPSPFGKEPYPNEKDNHIDEVMSKM